MNKKESDRIKALAKKQQRIQQSMLEYATTSSSSITEDCKCSTYWIWGITLAILFLVFI